MNPDASTHSVCQLRMPGMPSPVTPGANACSRNVAPGQEVMYLGKVSGGPRYGARGVVLRTLRRRIVVDMGRMGTWHIPYYFLAVPLKVGQVGRSAAEISASQ